MFLFSSIAKYFESYANVRSFEEAPVSYTYAFESIPFEDSLDSSIKKYLISQLSENGVELEGWQEVFNNSNIDSFESSMMQYNLHFEQVDNWQARLANSLQFWFAKDYSVSCNTAIRYLEWLFGDKKLAVVTFTNEDDTLFKMIFSYLKNEFFIFQSNNNIVLLRFGLDD